MDYIRDLRKLVCCQVDNFVRDVIHQDDSILRYVQNKRDSIGDKEYRKDNPNVPRNQLEWEFDARRQELMKKSPTLEDNGNQLMPELDEDGEVQPNSKSTNDQWYVNNLLDAYNSPFDHIDRIVLQDFTQLLMGD